VKSSRPFVVQPNRSSLLVWIFLCFIVALVLALLIIQPVLAEKKITAAEAKDHVDKAATAHPLSEPVATPAPQVTRLTQDSTQKKAIKVWVNTNSLEFQMSTNPASPHILVDLTCPRCKRKNSVAIKRGVSDVERVEIKCAYCKQSWEQELPRPFMAGPFPK